MTSALLSAPSRTSQLDSLRQAIGSKAGKRSRTLSESVSGTVLVCASGKGGSGTSIAATLLALSAAEHGNKTLLVDGDELVGPLAMMLGVNNNDNKHWLSIRNGKTHASELLVEVFPGLKLVPGGSDSSSNDVAPITSAERRACYARILSIEETFDLIVVDAGSKLETVLATLDSARTNPELIIINSGQDPVTLASSYALLKAVNSRHPELSCNVLSNRLPDQTAARTADTLAAGARQFLEKPLAFAGALPNDVGLDAALQTGMNFLDAVTGSPVAVAAHDTVLRLMPPVLTSRHGD